MGPRHFSRGYRHSAADAARCLARFNGATAFQPWIRRTCPECGSRECALQWGHGISAVDTRCGERVAAIQEVASMGPRHFSRGYRRRWCRWHQALTRFNGATAFQPWIRRLPSSSAMGSVGLQWGHGISAVDTWHQRRRGPPVRKLQWGHGISAVDTRRRRCHLSRLQEASMGPRHFSRGYHLTVYHYRLRPRSFNGATAFQPWIRAQQYRHRNLVRAASMGPRHFSRGYSILRVGPGTGAVASMGPRHFSRGYFWRR